MQEDLNRREPSVLVCLIPIGVLIALMVFNVVLFKDNATFGPNQIALSLSALLAGLLGVFVLKLPYQSLEAQIIKSIGMALQAVLILFVVGSLISVWIASGIVPLMIYYGLEIINPKIFLFVSCIVSCIVALCTGSSWSTSGTIGIALIAIGKTFNVPVGMIAGAVISGAYFGDKMSPLSDTTNLAPAMAGTDLFTHIRHMAYSSGPAILLSLVGFLILGFFYQGDSLKRQSKQLQPKFAVASRAATCCYDGGAAGACVTCAGFRCFIRLPSGNHFSGQSFEHNARRQLHTRWSLQPANRDCC